MTNTPDEAERLLNSLIGADRDYVLAYKPSCRADAEALRQRSVSRLEAIRSQLLPLIRSGLALQRLENFIRCQHYMDVTVKSNSKTRFNVLIDDDNDDSTFSMAIGDRESLPAAINAALDAAGVE